MDWLPKQKIESEALASSSQADVADLLAFIARVTTADDYLVTDHPYLAFLADRRVPPRLVDLGITRVRYGMISDQEVIQEGRRFRPKLVIPFWESRLPKLTGYMAQMVNSYSLVRLYGDRRAVYVRNSALRDIPESAVPTAGQGEAAFGSVVGFSGLELEPLGSGRERLVSLKWHILEPVRVTHNYVVHLELRGEDGLVRFQTQQNLLPAWRSSTWSPGPAFLQRRWLDLNDVADGEYDLTLRITRGPRGPALPPTVNGAGKLQAGPTVDEVTLGRVVLN
jgi:hypothetical protein